MQCSSSSRLQLVIQGVDGAADATTTYTIAAAMAALLSEPRLAVRAARRLSAASMRGSVGSSTQWSSSGDKMTETQHRHA